MLVRAVAPGRVNLIGDHTDYTDGWVLPMAIDLATTVELERGGAAVDLVSEAEPGRAHVALDVTDPAGVEPAWARYVAGVVAELRPRVGATGIVRTTLPRGAGLSSSAALVVAVALALGFEGSARALARLGQRAECRATGVPTGIMDQLTSAAGVEGAALLIDCATLECTPVALPAGVEVVVVHSGLARTLAATAYAERRAQCEAAAAVIGPLRAATSADVDRLDGVLARRARHVVGENQRVGGLVAALAADDRAAMGRLLAASHASLRDDYEVSTPVLDALVERLAATPGVIGARLTGAGFGGCAVALVDAGVAVGGWRVRPAAGARVTPADR